MDNNKNLDDLNDYIEDSNKKKIKKVVIAIIVITIIVGLVFFLDIKYNLLSQIKTSVNQIYNKIMEMVMN